MATHKLATGPLIITVTDARIVEGNFGTQVRFEGEAPGAGDVDVYVNESTAIKQLERLAMDIHTVIGETLHIEQIKKDGRTYTNFRRITNPQPVPGPSSPDEVMAPTAARRAVPASGIEGVLDLYEECLKGAVKLSSGLDEAGFAVSADNLIAMTATIFIQASRR
jgi:hypothetical protein